MDKNYWHNRWEQGETKWDIGYISTPLKTFFDQLTNKEQKILIPGCGSGYEGEYLWRKGFNNVYQLDISEIPLQKFHERVPDFPKEQLLATDFFALEGPFDLVIEQTFFCALHPELRKKLCLTHVSYFGRWRQDLWTYVQFSTNRKWPAFRWK